MAELNNAVGETGIRKASGHDKIAIRKEETKKITND